MNDKKRVPFKIKGTCFLFFLLCCAEIAVVMLPGRGRSEEVLWSMGTFLFFKSFSYVDKL